VNTKKDFQDLVNIITMQNKYYTLLLTVTFLMSSLIGISQTWTHNFEAAGGYTVSAAECTDSADDYFIRTDGSNTNDDPTGPQGSFYFAAQDIDAAGCPAIAGANATIDFDDIDISGCTGLSFEVLAATFNTAGWDDNDFVHIYYDIDNSGVWTNLIWFENDGTAFNSAASVDTDFNGDGDGTVLNSTFQNITSAIGGTGLLIDIRIEIQLNSGSEDFAFDNLRIFGTCGAPIHTITTGAVSAPFNVDCAGPTTNNGTVAFTSTGTYTGTNVFTAQLSDETGSFTNATDIGTLTLGGTDPSGIINITIPATSLQGTGYIIRIVSDDPVATGSNSATFTINQASACGPSVGEGLIINEWSNGPVGNEEYYEFVVAGECGTTVDIRGYILDDNNGTFTNPADYSGTASGIAPGHFRFSNNAQWASIPVGSLIVVYNADEPNGSLPADDPTDSNNDSLYVVPHNNSLFERCTTLPGSASPDSVYTPCTYATAPLTGWNPLSLRNSGDAIQVRNPDGSYYHGVSYGGSEMTGGPHNLKLFTTGGGNMVGWFSDGDFFDIANWSSGTTPGNQTPGTSNNAANLAWLRLMRNPSGPNCPITVLPVEIGDFQGKKMTEGNLLYWNTYSERNSSHFVVQRTTDGKTWITLGSVPSVGESQTEQKYQFLDVTFSEEVNYYRLIQFDTDGTEKKHFKVVSIDNMSSETNELVGIFNLLGQQVDANYKGVQIRLYKDGTSQRIYKH
jgi:hypothetical protein